MGRGKGRNRCRKSHYNEGTCAAASGWSLHQCSRLPLGCSYLKYFQLVTSQPHLSRPTQHPCFPQPAGFPVRFAVKYLGRVCSTFLRRHTGDVAGGGKFGKRSVGALQACWALIKADHPRGGAQPSQQVMNSALQLKYHHFDKSSYNAYQINELLVLLTFTLPRSVDCKPEQLAPLLLILRYQLKFKASWHVLSLPCTFANCSGDISAFGRENITARHKETGAGIAKMERNLAESPTNQ